MNPYRAKGKDNELNDYIRCSQKKLNERENGIYTKTTKKLSMTKRKGM